MQITKINPLVWVFHELVKNPQEIIDFYENEQEWENWWTRGKITPIFIESKKGYTGFPKEKEWNENLYTYNTDDQEHPFSNILNYTTTKTITDSIYKASRLFFEANYPDIKEELFFLSFDIAKYFPGGEMTYHTDYDQEQFYKPGLVFHTTVLLYPNDNYDGGEISFIEMDSEENVLWRHDYKPKAGDIVIFNSRPPIYHGVSPNLNAEKYIIRAYWRTFEEPNNDWNKGIIQYGEDEWIAKQAEQYKYLYAHQISVQFQNEELTITKAPQKDYKIILDKLNLQKKNNNE